MAGALDDLASEHLRVRLLLDGREEGDGGTARLVLTSIMRLPLDLVTGGVLAANPDAEVLRHDWGRDLTLADEDLSFLQEQLVSSTLREFLEGYGLDQSALPDGS